MQLLFDPINPDKDTIESRQYNRRDRLDQEFWLLQKLATIMEKANFHELPKAIVEKTLREHNVGGVLVSWIMYSLFIYFWIFLYFWIFVYFLCTYFRVPIFVFVTVLSVSGLFLLYFIFFCFLKFIFQVL